MYKEINNNGFEYVDLDLPSGTLWATMNVGASKESDAGLYFQWGDTNGYTKEQVGKDKLFTWKDYKFNPSGDGSTFTKYTTTGATLELEDDAAHVNMGGDWHMPTPTQINELLSNTTNTWTTQDGVNGRLFTSKSDSSKSVFIPAAGYARDGSVRRSGGGGYVWSSVLYAGSALDGQYFGFYSVNAYLGHDNRCDGLSVRGVVDGTSAKNALVDEMLDLVNILKDVPEGTKLWSPIYGECTFLGVDEDDEDDGNNEHSEYPIICEDNKGIECSFTKEGKLLEGYNGTECILFPSKENRDWSTFKVQKKHKRFKPFQKVLVGLIGNGKQVWTRDVYMCYRKDVEEHRTVFESMVPDELIIPYDAHKEGKPVKRKKGGKRYGQGN